MSMMSPRIPLAITVHSIARGRSLDADRVSSAIWAGASPPIKDPTAVTMPTRHAKPAENTSAAKKRRE